MRVQAALLGEKTNQQVTANVQPVGVGNAPGEFIWSFQVISPALGSYRYELFRVSHSIALYPATFHWEEHAIQIAKDEAQFKVTLREILGSEQTKKIVQAILAQTIR